MTSQLNDLKSQHIASEGKKVDDKITKNSSGILGFESRLKQKEDLTTELERNASFFKGDYYYNQQPCLLYQPKSSSYHKRNGNVDAWKSTGIHDDGTSTNLTPVNNSASVVPRLLNQSNRFGVTFAGNYMEQDKIAYAHGSGLNIYIVYKLQKRTVSNPDFTVQNALFGAIKITKDVNTSHYQYHGYGICFDGNGSFSFGNNIGAKNVIIFGVDMSFRPNATNRANNVYVLGKDFVQGISNTGHTTIYAEKLYKTDFTKQDKKFVLSLHYNGDDSCLFVISTIKI